MCEYLLFVESKKRKMLNLHILDHTPPVVQITHLVTSLYALLGKKILHAEKNRKEKVRIQFSLLNGCVCSKNECVVCGCTNSH